MWVVAEVFWVEEMSCVGQLTEVCMDCSEPRGLNSTFALLSCELKSCDKAAEHADFHGFTQQSGYLYVELTCKVKDALTHAQR